MATITTINSGDQIKDSRQVINTNFSNLNNEKQDTLSKATGAEVNTGTDDDKYVTPKAIDDSDYQQIKVTDTEPTSPATGDLWLDIS